MKNLSFLAIFLMILLNFTGCASNRDERINSDSVLLDGDDINIVFLGALSLPFEQGSKSIWIDKGPIVIVQNEANIAYRIIDKQELEFIGTLKSPYEFFKSALNKPNDKIELLFMEGLGKTNNSSFHMNNNVEIFILEIKNTFKIYILSPSLDFVVEVTSKINSNKFVEKIISKTHLK